MSDLTDKQARFVEEYLIDLNATQAAIRAGYSPDTAGVIGCENLTKPNIQEAIQTAQEARSKRTQIDQDWVIKRLAALADADIKRVCEWDAGGLTLIDSEELAWEDTYTVTEVILKETIKETQGSDKNPSGELVLNREKRIKQADKKGALELLGKHLGIFPDRLNLSGKVDSSIDHTGRILHNHRVDLTKIPTEDLNTMKAILEKGQVNASE